MFFNHTFFFLSNMQNLTELLATYFCEQCHAVWTILIQSPTALSVLAYSKSSHF